MPLTAVWFTTKDEPEYYAFILLMKKLSRIWSVIKEVPTKPIYYNSITNLYDIYSGKF